MIIFVPPALMDEIRQMTSWYLDTSTLLQLTVRLTQYAKSYNLIKFVISHKPSNTHTFAIMNTWQRSGNYYKFRTRSSIPVFHAAVRNEFVNPAHPRLIVVVWLLLEQYVARYVLKLSGTINRISPVQPYPERSVTFSVLRSVTQSFFFPNQPHGGWHAKSRPFKIYVRLSPQSGCLRPQR